MRGFDLVLTYNWGAFDAVMARRLFGGPPLVHHEDGFNEDEAERLESAAQPLPPARPARGAFRLVVPSERLERIARASNGGSRPLRIPNGVPVARFAKAPEAGAIPGFERRPGEVVIGTVAGLRAVKNLPRLVRAFAAHEPQGGAAGDRRRGAGERADRRRGARAGRRGAGADAGLSRRSGALDRPFRHFRFVVGQRAIPDLADRGDGGGPAGGGDRGRRRRRRSSPRTTSR